MKQKKSLHPVQKNLIKLLADNIDDPLTFKELQDALDVSSTSVVAHHIQQLEKKGYLRRDPYNPKNYQIMEDEPENPVAHLNLYGLAACGPNGSILEGDPIDRIRISSTLLSFAAKDAFLVKAKGKSMEPKIHDGDYIIARKTSQPESGKVYVCVNKGEALVKRLLFDGEKWTLHSFNQSPEFSPFIADKDEFWVEGEVKGIFSRKI